MATLDYHVAHGIAGNLEGSYLVKQVVVLPSVQLEGLLEHLGRD
jgi:hypothetical protein